MQADELQKDALTVLTARSMKLLQAIVARSHAAGTLRPDVGASHLRLATRMVMMTAMMAEAEPIDGQAADLDLAIDIVIAGLQPR